MDDLVKRLRECRNMAVLSSFWWDITTEAADAIEELSAVCKKQEIDLVEMTGELASKPHWIPVTERLPQDAGIYIICDHYGNVMSRHFCKSHGKFAGYWHFNGSAKYGNPTHWMPLPQAPKEETK